MASTVTMQPARYNSSSSAGMAVISFDLSATLRCPNSTPLALAQALTRCKACCPLLSLPLPRTVFPSTATTCPLVRRNTPSTQRMNRS
jgi:hypothetical protein